MNDDELRKLLQNSLAGRRAPVEVRERILQALKPRTRLKRAAFLFAAAVLIGALTAVLVLPKPVRTNPDIARAIEQHIQSPVFGHAASTATPREVAQTVSEASGRDIVMPGLRDAGFTQMQAHRCEATGWAHVVYANAWLKVSCFILDASKLDFSGGKRLEEAGIDAYSFVQGPFSVVALRESGLAKVWVADLRPDQLASVAVDAEEKRNQIQTSVFSMNERGMSRQMNAMLQSTPGIEDIHMEPSKQEAVVKYDRRRVTLEEIAALLVTNGFAASPRDWESR